VGAIAAVAGVVSLGLAGSMVAGDTVDANGVHSTTQKVAADARGLATIGAALTGVGLAGLGVGLFVIPGGGGDESGDEEEEGSGGDAQFGFVVSGRF